MSYLDTAPRGRARLLRQFILDALQAAVTVYPKGVAADFCRKYACSLAPQTATNTLRSMAREGVLLRLRCGHYCHAWRPVRAAGTLLNVMVKIKDQRGGPAQIVAVARQMGMSTQGLYRYVRILRKAGLVRKVKRPGRPVGYMVTIEGEKDLAPAARLAAAPAPLLPKPYNPFD